MKFHLYGTSLSGIPVDEYVVPAAQNVTVNWNKVTNATVHNVLRMQRMRLKHLKIFADGKPKKKGKQQPDLTFR